MSDRQARVDNRPDASMRRTTGLRSRPLPGTVGCADEASAALRHDRHVPRIQGKDPPPSMTSPDTAASHRTAHSVVHRRSSKALGSPPASRRSRAEVAQPFGSVAQPWLGGSPSAFRTPAPHRSGAHDGSLTRSPPVLRRAVPGRRRSSRPSRSGGCRKPRRRRRGTCPCGPAPPPDRRAGRRRCRSRRRRRP
jgi:hypothetical protein